MFKKIAAFLFTAAVALSASLASAAGNSACFDRCNTEYARCLRGHTMPQGCALHLELCLEFCYTGT